jgi:hypothetical protein
MHPSDVPVPDLRQVVTPAVQQPAPPGYEMQLGAVGIVPVWLQVTNEVVPAGTPLPVGVAADPVHTVAPGMHCAMHSLSLPVDWHKPTVQAAAGPH